MSNIQNNQLKLLEHQKEAYELVEKLFDEKGKAAVIFPTGCGKSFVTLKYILEHPDDRILFLSPRNAIKDQMYEYIIRFIGGNFRTIETIQGEYGTGNSLSESLRLAAKQYIPNIECMLYQTISAYGEKESADELISKLKPDVIIVDEMHHLKTKSIREAARGIVIQDDDIIDEETEGKDGEEKEQQNKWGEKFHKLLEANPQAKLLGLSATPIRTDGANVVERIFEDSIASEISLLQAIEQGIIYPPKYVVPDFLRDEELKTLLEKIEQSDGTRKEELKAEYDELVKKSSSAPGIPELMQEHITEKDGKYIIYCKDIVDMKEKMQRAKDWFGTIDENPEIYGIHSKDKTSGIQLEQFNNSNSEHLKLMYCVGMIDEGVHLKGVSGVILAARTGSRPTYLQRIGRAISSGKDKKQATVIDLVNNNEILYEDKVQHGYEVSDIELLQELIEWVEQNDGNWPEHSNVKSFKEKTMARRLTRINNKYIKYIDNEDLLYLLNAEKQKEIEKILELGSTIGMFEQFIRLELNEDELDIDSAIDSFLANIEIKGVRRDFRKMLSSEKKESNFELIMKWAGQNGRMPKMINKKKNERSNDENIEYSMYSRWRLTDEKKVVDSYTGKEIEEIPEEHQELVRLIRSYGYDGNIYATGLTAFDLVISWAKEKGRMPKGTYTKTSHQSQEEYEETRMSSRWRLTREKKIVDSYVGKKIEEIPEEHQELVRLIRSYGYKGSALAAGITPFEEVMNWIEQNGRMPKPTKKKAGERSDDEKTEMSMYLKWVKTKEKKIVDCYMGVDICNVPEIHRDLVRNIRSFGYISSKGGRPAKNLGKAVSKDLDITEIDNATAFIGTISKTKSMEGINYGD